MSQYGAEGAAREGLAYEEIAEFYYPGKTSGGGPRAGSGSSSPPTPPTTWSCCPASGSPCATSAPASRSCCRTRTRRAGGSPASPTAATGSASTREPLARRGARWTGLGAFSAGGDPVTLVTPSGTAPTAAGSPRSHPPTHPPRGSRSTRCGSSSTSAASCPLEIPALWSAAAVRAQAVAARTYAAYERAHPRASIFDLCDTWSCQVYGGVDAEHSASDDAIAATRRRILRYDGEPAFTQFGSSQRRLDRRRLRALPPRQGGPVRRLVRQPQPRLVGQGHRRPLRVRLAGPRQPAADRRPLPRRQRRLGRPRRAPSGWSAPNSTVTVSGDTLRSTLGLKSTWVTFRVR